MKTFYFWLLNKDEEKYTDQLIDLKYFWERNPEIERVEVSSPAWLEMSTNGKMVNAVRNQGFKYVNTSLFVTADDDIFIIWKPEASYQRYARKFQKRRVQMNQDRGVKIIQDRLLTHPERIRDWLGKKWHEVTSNDWAAFLFHLGRFDSKEKAKDYIINICPQIEYPTTELFLKAVQFEAVYHLHPIDDKWFHSDFISGSIMDGPLPGWIFDEGSNMEELGDIGVYHMDFDHFG